MNFNSANEHCRRLAAVMRTHLVTIEADIDRMKADIASEIDADCDCDNCVGFALTIERADTLLVHVRQLIDWLDIPVSP